jgi:hypothetical protein
MMAARESSVANEITWDKKLRMRRQNAPVQIRAEAAAEESFQNMTPRRS